MGGVLSHLLPTLRTHTPLPHALWVAYFSSGGKGGQPPKPPCICVCLFSVLCVNIHFSPLFFFDQCVNKTIFLSEQCGAVSQGSHMGEVGKWCRTNHQSRCFFISLKYRNLILTETCLFLCTEKVDYALLPQDDDHWEHTSEERDGTMRGIQYSSHDGTQNVEQTNEVSTGIYFLFKISKSDYDRNMLFFFRKKWATSGLRMIPPIFCWRP